MVANQSSNPLVEISVNKTSCMYGWILWHVLTLALHCTKSQNYKYLRTLEGTEGNFYHEQGLVTLGRRQTTLRA